MGGCATVNSLQVISVSSIKSVNQYFADAGESLTGIEGSISRAVARLYQNLLLWAERPPQSYFRATRSVARLMNAPVKQLKKKSVNAPARKEVFHASVTQREPRFRHK